MTIDEIGEFATVRQWLQAYSSHWNRSAEQAELGRKLELLRRYCQVAQKDPDALVNNLLRDTPTLRRSLSVCWSRWSRRSS
jgi:hypothetical protein